MRNTTSTPVNEITINGTDLYREFSRSIAQAKFHIHTISRRIHEATLESDAADDDRSDYIEEVKIPRLESIQGHHSTEAQSLWALAEALGMNATPLGFAANDIATKIINLRDEAEEAQTTPNIDELVDRAVTEYWADRAGKFFV